MSGGIAGRGRPGPAGPQGPLGPQGPQGEPAFSLAIGHVTAVPYGDAPSVQNAGTAQDQIWDLALPTGATGVLTGSAPPTGADGTSLGQLYYCTTNQTYYGLIELTENNTHKWRPLMTQDTAIRTYHFDIVGGGLYGLPTPENPLLGTVDIRFDDVKKVATISQHLYVVLPVGTANQGYSCYVDAREHGKLRVDAAACGISALPFPIETQLNGVVTSESYDFLGETAYVGPGSLTAAMKGTTNLKMEAFHPVEGDGANPGVRVVIRNGQLAIVDNESGAPASTAFGNAPSLETVNVDDVAVNIPLRPRCDDTYSKTVRSFATEVIPYA